jgi:hypothetical protein
MAGLRIDAAGRRAIGPDGAPPWEALGAALERLPQGAPLVVVTHGLRHSPFGAALDPHAGVLGYGAGAAGRRRTRSWMRRLHLGPGQALEGHGLAFGWAGHGDVWGAMARARAAGAALARVALAVRRRRPDLDVALMTHSLGARVALEAMRLCPRPAFDRLLLLAPADTRAHASAALRAPGAAGARIVAVQARENRPFDAGLALACARPVLSRGPEHPAWTDLVLPPAAPLPLPCHWSSYLRPGLWPAYRRWLRAGAPPDLPRRARPGRPRAEACAGGLAAQP